MYSLKFKLGEDSYLYTHVYTNLRHSFTVTLSKNGYLYTCIHTHGGWGGGVEIVTIYVHR